MCVDLQNLNNAYSKDSYLHPRIDKLVDTVSGHEFLILMDVYSGYHQIHIVEGDA